MPLSYLDLTTTDAAWNLALEQYVFDSLPRDRSYLLLWQNRSAVILGRHQNAPAEIDEAFVKEQGIQVVRRLSGGGAVYHDLGNLNYTFISDAQGDVALEFSRFCDPVIRVLRTLGVDARCNGRNDMVIGDRKFSGNAQYRREGRVMHHGTLLFDSDPAVLSQALRPDPEKIKAKGVASVRSRVTNIRPHLPRDMTLAQFRQTLLGALLEAMPGQPLVLGAGDLAAIETLYKDRYASWEWNFGASPPCTLTRRKRFEGCGTVEAHLTLTQGKISDLRFSGDFFTLGDPEALARGLVGCPRQEDALLKRLEMLEPGLHIVGLTAGDLVSLLA